MIAESYEFSWAGGNKSLFIVQLGPEDLTPTAVGLLQTMSGRLEEKRRKYAIKKIVIICDVQQISEGLHYNVIGKDEIALITHYIINEIKKEDVSKELLKKVLL